MAKLKVYAGQHQRRAARMLTVLEKFEQKNGQKDKGFDGIYDLQGSRLEKISERIEKMVDEIFARKYFL